MNHRHTILFTTAAAMIACQAHAQDQSGYYAKVYGGLSTLQGDRILLGGTSSALDFSSGPVFGGAIGYSYADSPIRAELEYTYRSGDAENFSINAGTNGDFASTSVMINGYYTFAGRGGFTPYVGLGIGYVTEIDFDIAEGSAAGEYNDTGGFAAQAMVGVEYNLSDRWAIYGEARYFSAGTADLTGPGGALLSADYDTLDILAGVTVRF